MKKKSKSSAPANAGQTSAKKQKKENDKVVDGVELVSSGGHPLSIGHNIMVRYRDGSHRTAKVIERSSCIENAAITWQYYVHYHQFNRRMDEWIDVSRIVATEGVIVEDDHHGHAKSVTHSAEHSSSENANDEAADHHRAQGEVNSAPSIGGSQVTTIAELGYDEHEGLDEASLLEHEEITKVKNIRNVVFGKYKMECWYFSPFPKEFHPKGPVDCLYFCEFTFRFFRTKNELVRYQSHANLPRHPPGNEIYRDSRVSMFELDGAVEKIYCQNLCYFAKLFLDHKTLYWDVDPFLFYVLCTFDDRGFHPVGFFSKEKYSDLGYNLACILTFPSAQRQGFGKFLISFSYELSKKEEKVGSPEKPLSDLGAVSYKSYWASTLLVLLRSFPGQQVSIMDLTKMTSILADDVAATLQMLGLLQRIDDTAVLCCPPDVIDALIEKYPHNSGVPVDPSQLHWAPLYVTDPRKDKWSIKAKKDGSDVS